MIVRVLDESIFMFSLQMAHSMAQVASNILSRHYNMPVHIDAVKDSEQHAFGNGSGIM